MSRISFVSFLAVSVALVVGLAGSTSVQADDGARSADRPKTIEVGGAALPPIERSMSEKKRADVIASQATAKVDSGVIETLSGYGNRLLEKSGWSPVNSNAYHWFYTNVTTWDTWFPPSENARVTSGDAQPRWLATTPYNPYLIQLSTTWSCPGTSVTISVAAIGGTWGGSGSSRTLTCPPVYNKWNPSYYYPYKTFECNGFLLSSIQQTDSAFIQRYSSEAAYLVVISDSEGIGAF
jgi:hypothetical protein